MFRVGDSFQSYWPIKGHFPFRPLFKFPLIASGWCNTSQPALIEPGTLLRQRQSWLQLLTEFYWKNDPPPTQPSICLSWPRSSKMEPTSLSTSCWVIMLTSCERPAVHGEFLAKGRPSHTIYSGSLFFVSWAHVQSKRVPKEAAKTLSLK